MTRVRWFTYSVSLAIAATLTACGGGGGDNPPPADDPPVTVTLNIADAESTEGDSGEAQLEFTVSASPAPPSDVSVDYSTSDGSALAGSDYTAASGTLTIPAGADSSTIAVAVSGDTDPEPDETFTITLDAGSAGPGVNVVIGTDSATGLIRNNDIAVAEGNYLNDTGVTRCAVATMNGILCSDSFADDYPGQDGEYGTDVTDNDPADGRAGFSFTKLDGSGTPLVDQTVSYDVETWTCVRDEVTGLVWEVKTDDDGEQDRESTYSWYNSAGVDDGGASGVANGGVCHDADSCDTEKFIATLNAANLCGVGDWRVPTRGELLSIVDFGAVDPPSIDTDYFPNTLATFVYWTRTTGYSPSLKLTVSFHNGGSINSPASWPRAMRAVSGGN